MAINHGASAYANAACRCDVCRKANTDRIREQRHRREQQVKLEGLPEGLEHGRNAYANWGCRCEVCSNAWREKMNKYYKDNRTSTLPFAPKAMSSPASIENVEKTPSLRGWRAAL